MVIIDLRTSKGCRPVCDNIRQTTAFLCFLYLFQRITFYSVASFFKRPIILCTAGTARITRVMPASAKM